MDIKLEKMINRMYRGLLFDRKTKRHRFLVDIDYVEEVYQRQAEYMNAIYDVGKSNFEETMKNGKKNGTLKPSHYCESFYNRKNTITPSKITSTFERTKDAKTEDELFNILNEISDLKLIGTIQSISQIKERFVKKGNNDINILIVGAGPNGLFLANYINQLYNNNYSNVRANILVLDNRIYSETVRYPYIRNRLFSIATRYLDVVLPGIYCKKNVRNGGMMIPIRYLELLLYMKTYEERIPLFFTKKYEKYSDLKDLISHLKIDVMYDSSGGRIEGLKVKPIPDLIKNVDMETNRYGFKISENEVQLDLKGHMNRFLSFEVYGEKMIYFEPVTFQVKNESDFNLLHGLCIKKDDLSKVIVKIKDEHLQKLMIGLYHKYILKDSRIEYIQLNSFEMKMYHRLKVAEVMKAHRQSFLYIGTGDTIFSSHYIVGAGLNRTLLFSIKTAHLLNMLQES